MSVEEGAPRWGRVSMASTPQSPQRRRIWGWLGGWLPLPQVRQQSYKRRTWPNWLFLGSFLISEDSSDVHVVEQVTANSLKRRITSQGNKKPPTHTHTHTHTHTQRVSADTLQGWRVDVWELMWLLSVLPFDWSISSHLLTGTFWSFGCKC